MDKLAVISKKIISQEALKSYLSIWKFQERKIVFTNGCFDILHRGHIEYLAKASELGHILIVGLNSDRSVRSIKGDSRPIQDEASRALILAALHFTSYVVIFDEDTPYELINLVKPDVLVKGSDWKAEDIVGYDIVKAKGGSVATIDFVPGYSTTNIVKKMEK
jgi:D-glycero-beta-D-manno-heptose 1-phosphate adenylyltransferase